MFLSSLVLRGELLINIVRLIIGIVVGSMIAGIVYGLWLRFSLWLMKKWGTTKKYLGGSLLRRLMKLNIFSFIISFLPLVIVAVTYNILSSIQQSLLIGLLFIILGGIAIVSLLLVIVFLILMFISFIASSPKKFWTSLLIMWSVGGICLLISAFYV